MATYRITAPDGGTYEITAPDSATEADVLSYAQANYAKAAPDSPPATDYGPFQKPYSGSLLPFSVDERGGKKFDPSAGLLGPFYRGVETTRDVVEGKLDPTSKEAIGRNLEIAAVMSPASAALRASGGGLGITNSYKKLDPKIPTAEELRKAANSAYTKVRESGVEYAPSAISKWADDAINALNAEGRIAELNPDLFSLLNRLKNAPEGAVSTSPSTVDAFRQRLGDVATKAAKSGDSGVAAAAGKVIKSLDDWLENVGPSGLVDSAAAKSGGTAANVPRLGGVAPASPEKNAELASSLLKEARGNQAAAYRSDKLTGIEDAAELRAAAANSGQNIGNNIRARLATLLLNNNQSRGFSKEELAAIESVVDGTPTTNALRYVGNLLGGGGGLGQMLAASIGGGAGAFVGGGPGAMLGAAVPSVAGASARAAANKLTKRQIAVIDEMARSRSPLYRERLANPQYDPRSSDMGSILGRAAFAGLLD